MTQTKPSLKLASLIILSLSLAACSNKVEFAAPQSTSPSTAQGTVDPVTPEPVVAEPVGDVPEVFEVSSGAAIDAADNSGEITMSSTIGTVAIDSDVATTTADTKVNAGFWSILSIF